MLSLKLAGLSHGQHPDIQWCEYPSEDVTFGFGFVLFTSRLTSVIAGFTAHL